MSQKWRLTAEHPIEEELPQTDQLSPKEYYRPQIPREYRDERERTPHHLLTASERRRLEEERRYLDEQRRYPREDRRYHSMDQARYHDGGAVRSRRYEEERGMSVFAPLAKSKLEGRNYRKELMERFSDMSLEEDREFSNQQRYYE
ncbi:unnamed protein product [Acanthoscelides obtectus]|uniref:Uncharacterized protein n=1 Tax=Acanthoscelides obtectus TaxID=200917 RepID=A0A9P0P0D1_ACAOB|nr:unnamed protein product [Acanthoscelides obtectus]CAK1648976.1 hypothetical protein AOBTE_LOCUS15978 [Acanthoscelides obtectus]